MENPILDYDNRYFLEGSEGIRGVLTIEEILLGREKYWEDNAAGHQ